MAPRVRDLARGACGAAMLAGVIAGIIGCAGPSRDAAARPDSSEPTLAPPSAARGERPEVAFVALDAKELGIVEALPMLSPKIDMAQRMSFVQGIEYSGRAADARAQSAAAELLAAYRASASSDEFGAELDRRFVFERCSAFGGEAHEGRALLTAYATPVVEASRAPDARHRYPLFADLRAPLPELATAPRADILASPDARARAIGWVEDPLAWALVETNGTAIVRFPAARGARAVEVPISRVATNGRPFTSLARGLAAKGLLELPKATLDSVAKVARENPETAEAAALSNERVVFFAPADPATFPPALGLAGDARLLPGISCAADWRVYPPGTTLLLVERRGDRAMLRFAFVHDSGGAIEGPGRVDLYFGVGAEAIASAGRVRGEVEVYRLRVREGAR
jgi:membrane-bound lytic murein transglycosylase